MLVNEIANSPSNRIKPESFGLDYQEFKAIINEIEYDGLFEKGYWALQGFYIFTGLTFKGRNFMENNDKKQYHKIEKTEVNYHHNVNVGGNNNGNIVSGSNNIIHSEFNQRFNDLLNAVTNSDIQDKDIIINELNKNIDNQVSLNKYIGTLLTRGAEVASITSAIGSLLSL